MSHVRHRPRISSVLAAVFPLLSLLAAAQEKKEFSYAVGPKAVISITNHCGSITVKPSGSSQVLVTTIAPPDVVSFVNEQDGNRIELQASCGRQGSSLVNYTVMVPVDAVLTMRSSDGSLRAQGLRGDVIVEAIDGPVEVADISEAHLHVKSLSGPISLSDIHSSHLEIRSVSGNITIHNVSGPSVNVSSTSGQITYDGDPGSAGDYRLTSHTGDLDVSIPATAPVEIKARSLRGGADEEIPAASDYSPSGQKSLLKPGITNASRFVLRSFRGKINVKRP